MNGNPERELTTWDDEIDLRQLFETLLQRKWIIIGFVVVAVAAAAVYSYFIATPKYESTVVVAPPDAESSERFGFGVASYGEFASAGGVLENMIRDGDLDMGVAPVKKRLHVAHDTGAGLLRVTADASTAEESAQLAGLWRRAFQAALTEHATVFIDERLQRAEDNVRSAEAGVFEAVEAEAEFEREQSLSVKESRLKRWENELIAAEGQRDELTEHLIPTDAGRVAILEELLAGASPALDADSGHVVVPEAAGSAGVSSSAVTILNPAYLELSQDLSRTRSRLAANELQGELLERRLSDLPERIDGLRAEIVGLRAEQTRLANERRLAEQLHKDVLGTYERLSLTRKELAGLTSVTIIAEPIIPTAPVSPRKMLNIALAAVLGGFIGVGSALFMHFWQDETYSRAA